MNSKDIDVLWDDNPVDITNEANFIWSIANKIRGTYMPDKYNVGFTRISARERL